MDLIEVEIDGNDPIKEILFEISDYPVGVPVIATGKQVKHKWFFITTKEGLRKPVELEAYLFKN